MAIEFRSELTGQLEADGFGVPRSISAVAGGSINDAYELRTDLGTYFLKVNSAIRYPEMFIAESKGLALLSNATPMSVPRPLATGQVGELQYILMEWIPKGSPSTGFWDEFGRGLAELHSTTNTHFGSDHDNYIGSLRQSNTTCPRWSDFYRDQRIIPQMELAARSGWLTSSLKSGFENLLKELDSLFPIESPALIHGDLWSGNLMVTSYGEPCILDPAAYYGHREMDLAMMALFGGFGDKWTEPYNEVFPLENGWKERIPIAQLYPLMVHVNLFGKAYLSGVESVLGRYL